VRGSARPQRRNRLGLALLSIAVASLSLLGVACTAIIWPFGESTNWSIERRLLDAELALSEGRPRDAEKLLKGLAAFDSARIHLLLGRTYIELRNTSFAILHFLKALDKKGNAFDCNFGLGRAYSEVGLHDLAATYLRQAVEIKPTESGAWRALAKALKSSHRDPEAQQALSRTIQLDPTDIVSARELHEITYQLSRPLPPHEVRSSRGPSTSLFTPDDRLDHVGRKP